MVYIRVAESIIMHGLTIMWLISSPTARRLILSSLETAQYLMRVNMPQSHRQRKLKSLLAIFLFFPLDVWGPAVSLRLLCDGSTLTSLHLPVPHIRCSSWLSVRMHLLKAKGQNLGKELYWSLSLQIQPFTHLRQAARGMSILIGIQCQTLSNASTALFQIALNIFPFLLKYPYSHP